MPAISKSVPELALSVGRLSVRSVELLGFWTHLPTLLIHRTMRAVKVWSDLKGTESCSSVLIDIIRNLDKINFKSFISLNFYPNLLIVGKENHEMASIYSLPTVMNNVLRLDFVAETQGYSLLPQ